jgi:hypothetical protein
MYNQEFLDIMDDVNAMAKSMDYTNGIAWAREEMENNRLSEIEFDFFEDCHDLRNLIAHGCSRDINISEATKQKAIRFKFAISNAYVQHGEQVKQSFLKSTSYMYDDYYNDDLPF